MKTIYEHHILRMQNVHRWLYFHKGIKLAAACFVLFSIKEYVKDNSNKNLNLEILLKIYKIWQGTCMSLKTVNPLELSRLAPFSIPTLSQGNLCTKNTCLVFLLLQCLELNLKFFLVNISVVLRVTGICILGSGR